MKRSILPSWLLTPALLACLSSCQPQGVKTAPSTRLVSQIRHDISLTSLAPSVRGLIDGINRQNKQAVGAVLTTNALLLDGASRIKGRSAVQHRVEQLVFSNVLRVDEIRQLRTGHIQLVITHYPRNSSHAYRPQWGLNKLYTIEYANGLIHQLSIQPNRSILKTTRSVSQLRWGTQPSEETKSVMRTAHSPCRTLLAIRT